MSWAHSRAARRARPPRKREQDGVRGHAPPNGGACEEEAPHGRRPPFPLIGHRGARRARAVGVEATAGNTGIALALVAAALGYRLVCVMPEKMSADERGALRALGAELVITPNAAPLERGEHHCVAERLARERGYFLTDQFRSAMNVRAHEETTAVEILEQTGGRVGALVAGAGTGGTIKGVGRACGGSAGPRPWCSPIPTTRASQGGSRPAGSRRAAAARWKGSAAGIPPRSSIAMSSTRPSGSETS